ncbi:hypothetical protein ACP70R_027055 [Stipagrostis hirtigluma subsp. patula]
MLAHLPYRRRRRRAASGYYPEEKNSAGSSDRTSSADRPDFLLFSLFDVLFSASAMALSSIFRRVNVKDLTSSVSVYATATELSGGLNLVFRRWATKKTAGSTKNGRDSNPKYLGVKKFGGEKVEPGNIIVRQRGTRFHPGNYVGMGKDHTLFCLKEGHVRFERNKLTGRKWVHVDPVAGHVLHPIYADGSATTADTEALH